MQRTEVTFPSANEQCAGWWYSEPDHGNRPVVVMAHGFGATRELGLDAFARQFCQAGFCVLAFDFRHYGGSEGQPREVVSIAGQQADYRAALAFARSRPEVDPLRAVLWGVSFSGGHVIALASQDLQLSAVIAQTPFASAAKFRHGPAALRPAVMCGGLGLGLCDMAVAALGGDPVYIPLLGADDTLVAMPGAETERGYRSLFAPEVEQTQRWRNRVAARLALSVALYEPARDIEQVQCPILFVVAEQDALCPAAFTRKIATRCPRAELVTVPGGHFDCFQGEIFAETIAAELAFLQRHGLGLGAAERKPTALSASKPV